MFKRIRKMLQLKKEPTLARMQGYINDIRNGVGWKYLCNNDNGGKVLIKNNRRSVAIDYGRKLNLFIIRKLGWFNLFGISRKPPCLCEFKYCVAVKCEKADKFTGERTNNIVAFGVSLQGINTKTVNGKHYCTSCGRLIKERVKVK